MADKRPIVDPSNRQQLKSADRLEVESIVSPSELTLSSSAYGAIGLSDQIRRDAWSAKSGLIDGGRITAASTTQIDISDGSGQIIDHKTDPANPVYIPVTWSGLSNITLTNLATAIATTISIDKFGAVVQTPQPRTPISIREQVVLGVVTHPAGVISSIVTNPSTAYGLASSFEEFMNITGQLNVSGNVYSANGANLLLDKTVGTTFSLGGNYANDINNPNQVAVAAQSGITVYLRAFQDGSGGWTQVPAASIDPDIWDDGSGTPASVSPNKWTAKRISLLAEDSLTVIELGQKEYNNRQEAIDGVKIDDVVRNPSFSQIALRAWLIVKEGETDLTSADTTFVTAPDWLGLR